MSLIDFNKLTKEEKIKLQKSYRKLLTWRDELEKSGDEDAYPIIDCNSQISKLEELFGKENFQPEPEIKTWDDFLKEFHKETDWNPKHELADLPLYGMSDKIKAKIIATAKIAKLIELGYGGMITEEEWQNPNEKFVIKPYYRRGKFFLERSTSCNYKWFIAFHTAEQREAFLSHEENRKLVEEYYMI